MASLLLAVIVGTAFAILATQNTAPVAVHLGNYTWSQIPLYAIAIGSLFIGLVISFLLNIFDWAASSISLHRKESRAQKAEATISDLQAKIHDLEERNTELKAKLHETNEVHSSDNHSPIHRFTHTFTR